MRVHTYLFFEGRCAEAMLFYKEALGARLEKPLLNRDNPRPPPRGMLPPDTEDKVLHASFRIGDTLVLASDGLCRNPLSFLGFSLALSVDDAAEAERVHAALSEGGMVQMPLGKTFWSPCFGMVADKFGVTWMISVDN